MNECILNAEGLVERTGAILFGGIAGFDSSGAKI